MPLKISFSGKQASDCMLHMEELIQIIAPYAALGLHITGDATPQNFASALRAFAKLRPYFMLHDAVTGKQVTRGTAAERNALADNFQRDVDDYNTKFNAAFGVRRAPEPRHRAPQRHTQVWGTCLTSHVSGAGRAASTTITCAHTRRTRFAASARCRCTAHRATRTATRRTTWSYRCAPAAVQRRSECRNSVCTHVT